MQDDKTATQTTVDDLANWQEFQNMVAAHTMWLPEEMRRAQAASWARANVATGDPRFD